MYTIDPLTGLLIPITTPVVVVRPRRRYPVVISSGGTVYVPTRPTVPATVPTITGLPPSVPFICHKCPTAIGRSNKCVYCSDKYFCATCCHRHRHA